MPKKSILGRMKVSDDDDDYQLMHEGGDDKYKDDLEKFKAPTGFNRDRGCCIDCLCSLVFLAFMGSMAYLTFLGFKEGDI